MNHERISQAVSDCFAACCASPYPLGTLAEFLARLEDDPSWTSYDIQAVELRVLRVFNRVASQSPEDSGVL
jgi:hypothetical protein